MQFSAVLIDQHSLILIVVLVDVLTGSLVPDMQKFQTWIHSEMLIAGITSIVVVSVRICVYCVKNTAFTFS